MDRPTVFSTYIYQFFATYVPETTYRSCMSISSFLQYCSSYRKIVKVQGLDGPRIESRRGERFSAPVQTGPGTYPASYTMGTGSFPGVKRPGRGVDHPPPN